MTKNTNFGSNFGLFRPNLDAQYFLCVLHILKCRHCSKLLSYTITCFWPVWPKFDSPKLFCQVLPPLVFWHCSNLSFNVIKGKLMLSNQTWENGKKNQLILGLLSACFGPNYVAKTFLGLYPFQMLNIVAIYHCKQFQGELINRTW